jgi:hypothetical protein
MKKNRDDQNWAIIHMEIPQGNALCSYLKQAKMSFYFSFFCKIGEEEGGTGTSWVVGKRGMGRRSGKDVGGRI